jgi:hypothetical protein
VKQGLPLTEHLSEDILEEYAFNRLSDDAVEPLEEHLLICVDCQERLGAVDDYIRLMKSAARKLPAAVPARSARFGLIWAATAAVAAVVTVGILLNIPRASVSTAAPVELAAFRGADQMTHAVAGRMLDLSIDVSDLSAPAGNYRVQVVDASGREEWSGQATPAGSKLSAHVSKALSRGVHWVRVSSSTGELLREFGLRID